MTLNSPDSENIFSLRLVCYYECNWVLTEQKRALFPKTKIERNSDECDKQRISVHALSERELNKFLKNEEG